MRVVLDANVYVSALINAAGSPGRILAHWENGAFNVLISPAIVAEVGRVLRYPRIARCHGRSEDEIGRFLELLSVEAVLIETTGTFDVVAEDASDNRYLECAVAGSAQYIVSGDRHLLDIGEYVAVTILPPAAFVALLERDIL
jgi:uncharacterized protein